MTILVSEAERQRLAYRSLTRHYRGIGPAAVLAALIYSPRRQTVSGSMNPQLAKALA